MPARQYMTWAAAPFVTFYVIKRPDGPAGSVGSAAGGIASADGSLTAFVDVLG